MKGPAPVRVPSQRPLAPSVSTVKSVANDKGDNEMILGAVHRSPGICLIMLWTSAMEYYSDSDSAMGGILDRIDVHIFQQI